MDQRCRDLIQIGDRLFSKRGGLESLWQEIALNFNPVRADFTVARNSGADFAGDLFTSYPLLAHRELANLFASMLRPRSSKWFGLHVSDEAADTETENRRFLEYMTDIQWRAMYDPISQFVRATKEADQDFASFGQAVIQVTPNPERTALLHRAQHIRDCAWSENASGKVDALWRKWNPTARQLKELFPTTISAETQKACTLDPEKEVACYHVVVPSRLYNYQTKGGKKFAFTSLYVERESETILEETGVGWFEYVVPRWQTVSGSQYAVSPATYIALADARTMQAVVRTIREAGEKFVDPPMLAVVEALRSDIALYAGGVTAVDIEYDERLGEVLRPLAQDKGGMPIGFEIAAALRQDINSAFYLDQIKLPNIDSGKMTAFEVRRRVEEHIRASAPLFEPVEQDYNAPLCEVDFEILKANGAFGPPEMIPEGLRGAEVEFTFSSPLRDIADQGKAAMFAEGLQAVVGPAATIDPAELADIDLNTAKRDSLRGLGWPATWLKDKKEVAKRSAQLAEQKKVALGMQAAGAGAEVVKTGAEAAKLVNEAEAA